MGSTPIISTKGPARRESAGLVLWWSFPTSRSHSAGEKQNVQEPEVAAVPFGDLMAELFVYREDAFQHILRPLGFYLGQYVYILDAYLDVEEDVKKTCYNPFAKSYQDTDFDEKVKELLEHTIQMAIVEFEKLPLEQDLAILRNILYEGVWIEYERKRRNDRSV